MPYPTFIPALCLLLIGVMFGWVLNDRFDSPRSSMVAAVGDDQLQTSPNDNNLGSTRSPPSGSPSVLVGGDLELSSVKDTSAKSGSELSAASGPSVDCKMPTHYETCREHLIQSTRSPESLTESIRRLDAWLSEYPEDLDVGLLLVKQLVEDRQYDRSIATLQAVSNYQTDLSESSKLAGFVKSMLRTDTRLYRTNNKLGSLVSMYKILIAAEQQNPRWRYELAELKAEMGRPEEALDILSYILYDPDFGESAIDLSERIREEARQPGLVETPIARRGAQYLIEARLNSARLVTLLIDTGASITSLSGEILDSPDVAKPTGETARLNTAGGVIVAPISALDSIDVGGQVVSNFNVARVELAGEYLDGLLGMDFLGRFEFAIDQEDQVLRLVPKSVR